MSVSVDPLAGAIAGGWGMIDVCALTPCGQRCVISGPAAAIEGWLRAGYRLVGVATAIEAHGWLTGLAPRLGNTTIVQTRTSTRSIRTLIRSVMRPQ